MITATDLAISSMGAEARNYAQILSDLERIQNDIKARILLDTWDGMNDLIAIKGKWEKILIERMDRIASLGDVDFFSRLDEYLASDLNVSELIKSRLVLLETEIRKASIARKMLAGFGAAANIRRELDAARGNFVDSTG